MKKTCFPLSSSSVQDVDLQQEQEQNKNREREVEHLDVMQQEVEQEQQQYKEQCVGRAVSHALVVELICQTFQELEHLDVMLVDHLQSLELSDADIEKETSFYWRDFTGNAGTDLEPLEFASFPVVINIGLEVKQLPASMVSVVFNLMDGRQFVSKLPRNATLRELKHAAEKSTGIPWLEQELLLNAASIDNIGMPLLNEKSNIVRITLVRSWMGTAATLARQLQAKDPQERRFVIENICGKISTGSVDRESIALCLGEVKANRINAEPGFLEALQACLSSESKSPGRSFDGQSVK